MIEIEDLTFQYREGDSPVVENVSLTIESGAFVGIIGAAGSGKSTLTYAMNGIVPHCYPGDFYGAKAVNHVRVALTATDDAIAEAAARLS